MLERIESTEGPTEKRKMGGKGRYLEGDSQSEIELIRHHVLAEFSRLGRIVK